MTTPLQLDDIQGFVVRGYTFLYARYLFLQFDTQAHGQQWLAKIVDWTTPATTWTQKPKVCQNIAFTVDGLKALGLADSSLQTFSKEFVAGMHTRERVLGDTEGNRADLWEIGNPTRPDLQIHALLLLFGLTSDDLKQFSEQHAQIRAQIGGITLLHSIDGVRRLDKKEHFGYLDGAGQPQIEGMDARSAAHSADPTRPLKAGEFVLGYQNEYGILPSSPTVPSDARAQRLAAVEKQPALRDFGCNGTYLVLRKLYQDVAAFRKFLQDNAPDFHSESRKAADRHEVEWLAAKLVGRWRSGTPLALSPEQDSPLPGKHENNTFKFGDDTAGLTTPRGSHIRRANPRDTFGLPGAYGTESFKAVNRHRIIRRGMPYGPPLQSTQDDGADRGLVFICINANIAVQYEFVQKWMNDPNFNGLYQNQDVFAHNHHITDTFAVIEQPPLRQRIPYPQSFVKVRGGAYFFMPGIAALRYLSASE
ncbi:MAG: Dyp-type peroxidase [Chloroflexi bacterium]|nr:Dyp-type peroxidase [Chloroflexota bacterium]